MTTGADDPRSLTIPDLIRLAAEHTEVTIPLKEYFEALRAGDEKLREADARFFDERDRRYAEVKAAEEKALRVKEAADDRALSLARDIQDYKDAKANELREQISSERGLYVTRDQLDGAVREIKALIQPLTEYTQSNAGHIAGATESRTERRLDTGLNYTAASVLIGFLILAVALYAALHR